MTIDAIKQAAFVHTVGVIDDKTVIFWNLKPTGMKMVVRIYPDAKYYAKVINKDNLSEECFLCDTPAQYLRLAAEWFIAWDNIRLETIKNAHEGAK